MERLLSLINEEQWQEVYNGEEIEEEVASSLFNLIKDNEVEHVRQLAETHFLKGQRRVAAARWLINEDGEN